MARAALLALAVGLVLADSSVVTLGLPDVLADFDVSPEAVAWVLTAYNLVLAVVAVPAALALRSVRRGRPDGGGLSASSLAIGGLVVFAGASLLCAVAPNLAVLIAGRCLQGLGGAAVACAALELLVALSPSRARAAALWGAAGAVGAAVGPAAGGALTDALSWRAIFFVQVPIALVCLLGARRGATGAAGAAGAAEPEPAGATRRPDVTALAALAFLGAGLTAALFLLVLLLIAGWRQDPMTAALTVSVMPAAALIAGWAGKRIDERTRGAAGAVLVAGGLVALGLLPRAEIGWTIAPQVLIGLGLGLGLAALTEEALRDRVPLALHGGWTIAARHAGVVAALAILTPLFTADLEDQTRQAEESVLARVLDAPMAPATKLSLGVELAKLLRTAESQVPQIDKAFDAVSVAPADRAAFDRLERDVGDQLDRAATSAFERSFIAGAILALIALLPLLAAHVAGLGPGPRPATA